MRVRMSQALKDRLIANGCSEHVEEFGQCVGQVEGPVDYGKVKGPEVDVRWEPGPTHQNLPGFRNNPELAGAVQLKTKKADT